MTPHRPHPARFHPESTAELVAWDDLHERLPDMDVTTLTDLIRHPRRCAPTLADYRRATSLPGHIAMQLWNPQPTTRTTPRRAAA